ncbi:MAG: tetratricopeptide repeat protein [Lachnospiraceae bacterium]|nr:tetratricopeptide repeat protein [Lachnospiraceae bacterium]
MDCWSFLEIRPTEDEGRIRHAYLEKLPGYHPEEDPDGFRQLRQALEDALKEAGRLKEERERKSSGLCESEMMGKGEIRELVRKAEEIYKNYESRIEPRAWEELLLLPVCRDLESQREAGWALISFLMDHFHLPHSCFQVFDKVFGWQGDESELYDHFPEGFVAYLFDRIREKDSFRYKLFELREGFDYDRFCEEFFTLRKALGQKDKEKVEESMRILDDMDMAHPDLTLLRIRHEAFQRGHEKQAWALADKLFAEDGDNIATRYWYVRSALDYKDSGKSPEELAEEVKPLLEQEEEIPGHWQLMGECLYRMGELSSALVCYQRARDCSEEHWDYIEQQIAETARELSFQMEEDSEIEDWWKFANICWMGKRYDQVREILENREPDENQRMSWLLMMAGSCHELEDYDLAVEYRQKFWDAMEPEKRPLRLYLDLANEYKLTDDTQRAMEIYEQAEKDFPGEPEICYRKAELLLNDGFLEEAKKLCVQALESGFHREAFNLRLEILLEQENYQEVRELAEQVFEQGYYSAQVRYFYVQALRRLDKKEEAEKALKELMEQTGEIGVVCQEYAGLCSELDRSEEALEWIEKALRERETPTRRYMKGQYLHDLERYEEEAELYKTMMESGLDSYYIHYRLARALESIGKYEESQKEFEKSLDRDASNGVAWDGLGDVLQDQGKWEEAAHAYEEGWKRGNFQAIRDLCRLMKRTHQNERTLEYLKQGFEKMPDDGSLLWIYACILRRQKKYEEAARCLGRYMEVKPSQTSSAYREIALCWENAKDYEKAEEYYERAVSHEPENAKNQRMLGKYYANVKKQQEKALPYLEKAVELEPDSTYGWMKLGEVYAALGRQQEAEACYERSLENYQKEIEKDPKDCCNYEGMADVLIHLGRLDEAEAMAQKAMSLQYPVFTCNGPACYEAMEDMAKLEEKRGNLKKALAWMERAGEHAVTDYYPKEIARLKAAIEEEK